MQYAWVHYSLAVSTWAVWGCVVPDAAKPPLNATTQEFGARIRARREELGLSQEAAALRCGIHWTQLGKVERGQRSVRLENIVKIAFGLEVRPGVLLDGVSVPQGSSDS